MYKDGSKHCWYVTTYVILIHLENLPWVVQWNAEVVVVPISNTHNRLRDSAVEPGHLVYKQNS